MAVFCEFISVIIRRDSIDKYYPGGWNSFVMFGSGGPMCCDGEIVNIGFMNPLDTSIYLDDLKDKGLQYDQSLKGSLTLREIDDVVVLDRFMGHHEKRDWLEFGDREFNGRKEFCCWLKGTSIETLAIPLGFFVKRQIIRRVSCFVTPDEFTKNYTFDRTENDLDIYLEVESKLNFECYMPMGMSIEDYYEQSESLRKKIEERIKARKEKIERLDKEIPANKKEENKIQTKETKFQLEEQDKTLKEFLIKKVEKKRPSAKERKKLKDYQLREYSYHGENGKLLIEQIWKGDLIVRKEYHYNGKLKSKKTLDKDGNEVSFEYFKLKRWFDDDVEPEDFSGKVGEILKEYIENPLNTMKKEKRKILDRLYEESKKQGYIFFWGYSHNFGISRVGDSYIYDVPTKKTGNLREFRYQRIRVICLGSGRNFNRSYIAGPLEK